MILTHKFRWLAILTSWSSEISVKLTDAIDWWRSLTIWRKLIKCMKSLTMRYMGQTQSKRVHRGHRCHSCPLDRHPSIEIAVSKHLLGPPEVSIQWERHFKTSQAPLTTRDPPQPGLWTTSIRCLNRVFQLDFTHPLQCHQRSIKIVHKRY